MIQPYRNNPRFWEYQGKPVLLLGGSVEDNLFQIPDLAEHLDLLASVGGNYIRCTMSSRDEGDVWPFTQDETTGKYDLKYFNPAYWEKFERLLQLTKDREIIVQIEVWDRFDFSRESWQENPFNPKKNINYDEKESKLQEDYPEHPGTNLQPFFYTVPACNDNVLVLEYQHSFVEKLLSISFNYDHVLYCMDNETSGSPEWGAYWADFILSAAQKINKTVYLTEMWDKWDIKEETHNATLDHPERYGFVDISQNNHLNGDEHWHNMQWRREYLAKEPRPMNMVKIYGADGNKFGHTNDDAIDRFWRGLLGGMASLRFHRPPAGLGLSPLAQANISTVREIMERINFTTVQPDTQHAMFMAREDNGAYLSEYENDQFLVYFPRRTTIELNITDMVNVFWINVLTGEWFDEYDAIIHELAPLTPPAEGHWLALVSALATIEK